MLMYMMQQLLIMAGKVMFTLNKLTSSTVDVNRAVNVFDNALIVSINDIHKRG